MKFTAVFMAIATMLTGLSTSDPATQQRKAQTVVMANSYDYTSTMIDNGSLLTPSEISELVSDYGSYGTTSGMTKEDYLDAMSYKWTDATLYKKVPLDVSIDLSKRYTYSQLVTIQRRLSSHNGVYLYRIGKSVEGRTLYAIEINLTTCKKEDEHTILLTGQVHARESAGPAYILKELIDLVNEYEKGSTRARKALSNVRFVAVACVNPDGHDGIGWDTKKWTYKDGQLWKATANGTDLNRNFPGLSWMQVKTGIKPTPYRSTTPDKLYYWGDSAGSCPETKAMMKFYQYFIGVEGAEILVDYHQQGRITYAGKGYAPDYNNELSESLRKACYDTQTKGKLGKHYGYDYGDTEEDYGLNGTGSTNTDYAWAVAMGTMFSTRYGFSVYADAEGNEYPLIMCPKYDDIPYDISDMRVGDFRTLSWEIGSGRDYLGYSENTLKLLEKEYYNYNFDDMLYTYVAEVTKAK